MSYQTSFDLAPAAPPSLSTSRDAVLLDFDGTLVELVDRPDSIIVDPHLAALLQALAVRFAGRVALVSGRSVAQLEQFFGAALGGIALVGSHGAEVAAGGHRLAPARPPALEGAEQAIRQAFAGEEGVVVEVKTLGVAIHWRLAPHAEERALALAHDLAAASGLAVQPGKMMIELRTGGHDKGSGIAMLMAQAPFSGSVPVFVGDDLTDEPGFEAVRALGGHGILVGAERPTAALYRLNDVAAVRGWLEQAA
ncbi:trehalose 6-phosphate phosphatase [Polymorphobacter multimanifer]|uniref:Trehalose 6-phosphate phosphatase n=1 Tax=Polymorphobacter multimanifer TaxID=1070431 RepID=A0A841L964_9SPHN|nr:trehalose-phosphatase [Polymorphobacter multimanifer]MBB6228151.1 trehalose 6-phosphate phosphatase [Polymorphobacter multimanifer]GGI80844.1 trehalose 6-phosphate phosphatase [Polymorphobacter multimanifer]